MGIFSGKYNVYGNYGGPGCDESADVKARRRADEATAKHARETAEKNRNLLRAKAGRIVKANDALKAAKNVEDRAKGTLKRVKALKNKSQISAAEGQLRAATSKRKAAESAVRSAKGS